MYHLQCLNRSHMEFGCDVTWNGTSFCKVPQACVFYGYPCNDSPLLNGIRGKRDVVSVYMPSVTYLHPVWEKQGYRKIIIFSRPKRDVNYNNTGYQDASWQPNARVFLLLHYVLIPSSQCLFYRQLLSNGNSYFYITVADSTACKIGRLVAIYDAFLTIETVKILIHTWKVTIK